MATYKEHPDPTVRYLLKLQGMATELNVSPEIQQQIERCLRSYFTSTLCPTVDNALFQGAACCIEDALERHITRDEAVFKFDDFVSKDERVYMVLVPLRDGVFMIRRKADVEGTVYDMKN